MIKVWSQLELGLQIKYCKHVFLYDFFGFFNNKYNIIWGGWENQLLSQLYKTTECWQNNMGHGKIIIMLLKRCKGFSFCCKTYLDTLIKPNRRFFSIFKMNMANAMNGASWHRIWNLLSKSGKHQQYDDITNMITEKSIYYHYKYTPATFPSSPADRLYQNLGSSIQMSLAVVVQVRLLALSLLFSFLSLDVLRSFILSRAKVTCSASSSELDTVQEK